MAASNEMNFEEGINYVGALQEYCVKSFRTPVYSDTLSGPPHAPTIKVECKVGDLVVAKEGQAKKVQLKRIVAFEMLRTLKRNNLPKVLPLVGSSISENTKEKEIFDTAKLETSTNGHQHAQSPMEVSQIPELAPTPELLRLLFNVAARKLLIEPPQLEKENNIAPPLNSIQKNGHLLTLASNTPKIDLNDLFPNLQDKHNYSRDLIEICNQLGLKAPEYKVILAKINMTISQSGPPHEPTIKVECKIHSKFGDELVYSEVIEERSSNKIIRKKLQILLLGKLQEKCTEKEEQVSDVIGEQFANQQTPDKPDSDDELMLQELPLPKGNKKSTRLVPPDFIPPFMGPDWKTALTSIRGQVGWDDLRILQRVIKDENCGNGRASMKFKFWPTSNSAGRLQCLLDVHIQYKQYCFCGFGLSEDEAKLKAATNALNMFELVFLKE